MIRNHWGAGFTTWVPKKEWNFHGGQIVLQIMTKSRNIFNYKEVICNHGAIGASLSVFGGYGFKLLPK